MKFCCLYCLLLLLAINAVNAQRIHIIPEPVSIKELKGDFNFTTSTTIYIDSKNEGIDRIVAVFRDQFERASGIELQVAQESNGHMHGGSSIIVSLEKKPEIKGPEGYVLNIHRDSITIIASALPGLFYAFESLKQLLPPQLYDMKKANVIWRVPCTDILDYPRYSYRGMQLDVSRHFFPLSFIKQYLDILATYKINTFHWHLTDSEGWRLQIKRYPKLTSIGAWRADRKGIPMTIAPPTSKDEPVTYGGYYNKAEVKMIIQYAKDRFITIIPEIEMPGHCDAGLVAYPKYTDLDNKTPLLIPCGYPGDLTHNFCVGYDSTYVFIDNILEEVMSLFPSKFIHIGGDEVRPDTWLNCPRCQKKMKELGISTAGQFQAYFTQRIDSFITAKGRRLMGWDEILQGKLSTGATVMSWHGNDKAIQTIRENHDVVMASYHYTYFDFYQSSPNLEPDITYAQLLLDTVYAFNPRPPGISDEQAKHILGGEACLWTENISTPARVEYMLLPRLLALSEVLWSPVKKKNYPRFINKVEDQFKRFDAEGINYSKSIYNVSITPSFDSSRKALRVTLQDQTDKYKIYYTTDGSIPTIKSKLYTYPLLIDKTTDLKVADFDEGKKLGKVNEDTFNIHKGIYSSIDVYPSSQDNSVNASYKRLEDGIYGTTEPYDGRWVTFHDSSVSIILKLDKVEDIRVISFHCMEDQVDNIFLPKTITISLSADGGHYRNVYQLYNREIPQQLLRHRVDYMMDDLKDKAQYVKIILKNSDLFKDDPNKNLLLLDEIVVQ